MDSKDEIDGLKNFKCKSFENIHRFKKNDTENKLGCEKYALLKKNA
jgi:hypothetical protein